MEANSQTVILKGKTYDVAKQAAQVVFPAIGALYFALAQIWGFPRAEDVVGTIAAINLFIGALVGISKSQYNKSDLKYDGTIDVIEDEDSKKFSLNYNGDPYELDQKKDATFKIVTPSGT